jgi:16S rRNA (guanine527-N7)-methyltransferase
LDELARWLAGRAFPLGLTNYAVAETVREHHIAPTLAVFCLQTPLSGLTLDLGAGSGALGLTLALLSADIRVILVDRRRRSAEFIALTIARLGLKNAKAMQVNAEGLAKRMPQAFDMICFRALAPAPAALSMAAPLLRSSGFVFAWHQSRDQDFLHPPSQWERLATANTSLAGLSVSQLRYVP